MKALSRILPLLVLALTLALSSCNKAPPNSGQSGSGAHGTVVPGKAYVQRYQPREDGWQNDPANQPHPDDANPLRRALGDSPIMNNLFGRPNFSTYLACSRQHAGTAPQGNDASQLSGCQALQQNLLQRVHAAGFSDATADDVLDSRLIH